jgi:hypothetical protein
MSLNGKSPEDDSTVQDFPWPNREVGTRRFAWLLISVFWAIGITVGAAINNDMLYSSQLALKNMFIGFVAVGVAFGFEMWFTVIRHYRLAFTILRYTAYASLVISFGFDLYFCWTSYEMGANFSFFGNDTNINPPALTIFLSVTSNIASLVGLYFGARNNWFYAAADNDSWD